MNQPTYDNEKRTKAATSALLRAVVACYLGYLGIKIFRNQDSSMQQTTAYLIGGAFLLAATGFAVYSMMRWRLDMKQAIIETAQTDISAEAAPAAESEANTAAEANAFADEIHTICANYLTAAAQAEQNRKPADGLFGFGKKPSDDPCHDEFANALEAAFLRIAKQSPSSAAVRVNLLAFYRLPQMREAPQSVYWMLNATQGLTLPLIEYLNPQDAEIVRAQYEQDNPRQRRLPVQNDICKALHRRTQSR